MHQLRKHASLGILLLLALTVMLGNALPSVAALAESRSLETLLEESVPTEESPTDPTKSTPGDEEEFREESIAHNARRSGRLKVWRYRCTLSRFYKPADKGYRYQLADAVNGCGAVLRI